MRIGKPALAVGVLALLGVAGVLWLQSQIPVPPQLPTPTKSVWLEQNWTSQQRAWFHHASQGTSTLPVNYDWFLALEQPRLTPFGEPGLFSDMAYLRRWGFIESAKSADNPDGLPVGFALTRDYEDPNTGKNRQAIGFTCAACHTGHFTYQGTELRIDGAPAMTSVTAMGKALGIAAVMTKYVPGRFERFARRVLGARYNDASVAELRREFDEGLQYIQRLSELDKRFKDSNVEEGFTRLDALTRIGNQVFSVAANRDTNYAPIIAPVSYPHIWNTSWHDWVQYDGSIMQPMVRNAGEALGVAAGVNLSGPLDGRFKTTAKLKTLHAMEQQLAGSEAPFDKKAYSGLLSPKWPEALLGRIDPAKAEAGRALYAELCQGCHLPAPDTPAFWDEKHWAPIQGGPQRYLRLNLIPIEHIGTDPQQNAALNKRYVSTTETPERKAIGVQATVWAGNPQDPKQPCTQTKITDGDKLLFPLALGAVVQQTIERWYAANKVPPEQQAVMNGERPNCLLAFEGYRARPLNGVWATAPFLHNSSVASLDELLGPPEARAKLLWLGRQAFDPVKVGLDVSEFEGGTRIDTRRPGNLNTGHEFRDAPKGTRGVIGRALSGSERAALIEYLKTL